MLPTFSKPMDCDHDQVSPDRPYSVTVLRQGMRCPEAVFDIAYKWVRSERAKDWFEREILPSVAHKVQGLCASKFLGHYDTLHDALKKTLEAVESELKFLNEQKTDFSGVGIACRVEKLVSLPHLLAQRCARFFSTDIEESKGDKPPYHSQEMSDDILQNLWHRIRYWDDVSSLEWPVVIYVSCIPSRLDDPDMAEYCAYRACSRATGKLIQIKVTYNDNTSE